MTGHRDLLFATWTGRAALRTTGLWFLTSHFLLCSSEASNFDPLNQMLVSLLRYLIHRGLFSSLSLTHPAVFSVIGAFSNWTTFGINFSNMTLKVISWQPHHTTKTASMGSWPRLLNPQERSANGSFLLGLFLSVFYLLCVLTQQYIVPWLTSPLFPVSGIFLQSDNWRGGKELTKDQIMSFTESMVSNKFMSTY